MLMMTRKVFATGVGVLAVISGSMPEADAQSVCDDNAKAEIAKLLTHPVILKSPGSKEALALEEQIAAKYAACAPEPVDVSHLPPEVTDGYCGSLSYLGNTSYEEMRCCGYDPQKRLFACPVEILKPVGFGPAPFPGSFENVLTCVDFGGGFQPVAFDRVHLADAVSGSPIWNFAVIASARGRLAQLPLIGQTLKARSILSWGFTPKDCYDKPYWGNAIDYQIRLDP